MTSVEPTELPPFRVLVVDDDAVDRLILSDYLNYWKYEVYEATASPDDKERFQALWQNAIDQARDHRCHLALVDVRLKGNSRKGGTTGKDLVQHLAPTVSILVSGHNDTAIVTAAVKSPPDLPWRAYDFVTKTAAPEVLLSIIREVEHGYWHRRILEPEAPNELKSPAIMRRFFPDDPTVPRNEVDDLLRRLFPTAYHLKLEAVSPTVQTSGLLLRHRSVVAKVEENYLEIPQIIKLARQGRSTKEVENFKLVWDNRGNSRMARPIDDPVELWDIGGVKYDLVNSDPQFPVVMFSVYYADPQHSPELIGKALKKFEEFWHRLYQTRPEAPDPKRKTLFQAYTKSWGDSWCRRLLDYRSSPWLDSYPAPVAHLGLGNPIEWLIRQVKLEQDLTYDDSALPSTVLALTHGDLHGDNLFVDTRQDVWVIDYERTGFGPILQDWVELETDILTHLAPFEEEKWAEYGQLLIDALSPQVIKLPASKTPGGFQRERQCIAKLRQLAASSSGETHVLPYLYGLLLNALFRLTLLLEEDKWRPMLTLPEKYDSALARQQLELGIQRCLVLAGLARHRLDNWHRTWPPVEWQALAPSPPARRPAPASAQQLASTDDAPLSKLRLQLTDLRDPPSAFRVEALDIANREPRAISTLPYSDNELVAVMKLLELGEYRADDFYPPQTAALQAVGLVKDGALVGDWCDRVGDRLFKALIPAEGGVRRAFENAFDPQRAGGVLHLTVDSEATTLACYPWEMLYDTYPTVPRAEIDVVRHINSSRTAQKLEVSHSPCGILYVSARPHGFAPVERDEAAIRDSIAHKLSRRFVLEPLPEHTHRALKLRLMDNERQPIHVLHFDGHGTFARLCPNCRQLNWPHLATCGDCHTSLVDTPPRGWLLFETPDGEVDPIDTVTVLEGIPRSEVRLVVLASCQSARVRGANLLLAGVGPGLILGGVPAVVAMQFSIAADEAIEFNKEFYRALNQGDTLPQSVNRARKTLPEPARWSPVLYLRTQDAQDRLCIQA